MKSINEISWESSFYKIANSTYIVYKYNELWQMHLFEPIISSCQWSYNPDSTECISEKSFISYLKSKENKYWIYKGKKKQITCAK